MERLFSASGCDQPTVTASLLDNDPNTTYSFQCRLFAEEMHDEYQRRGDIFGFVEMEQVGAT